ncbi:MAG TPA: hypothetical protein VG890_16945 [Puia sp.]|nr:hypothetical protein [Puia sp.]
MQKQVLRMSVAALIAVAVSFSASAQAIYVKVRPTPPVVVRTAAPGPTHVWIGEEWEARGGKYVFVGGHWAVPPHPGWVWVPGHWRHEGGHGEVWIAGHWRRR